MNYAATYCALISKRIRNPITKQDCYCELHHIIPRSEGGTNEKDNLVNLTAREHFVCHRLLAKIYNDGKMWFALHRMIYGNNHIRKLTIPSKTYEIAKQKAAAAMSDFLKGRHLSTDTKHKIGLKAKGNNRAKGKRSDESRKRMSIAQKTSFKCRKFLAEHNEKQGTRIVQMNIDGVVIKTYKSIRVASKETGIHRSQISSCCAKKPNYKTAGGYVWRYQK